jgi:hypothetical protein
MIIYKLLEHTPRETKSCSGKKAVYTTLCPLSALLLGPRADDGGMITRTHTPEVEFV